MDKEKKAKRKRRLRGCVSLLLWQRYTIIILLIMYFFRLLTIQGPWSPSLLLGRLVLFILSFSLARYLITLVHECGHLVGGLLSGFKLVSICVRKTTLVKIDGKLHRKRYGEPHAGGSCAMASPLKDSTHMPIAAYLVGGVVMTALFACLALFIFWMHPSFHIRRFLIVFIVLAIPSCIHNLRVPKKTFLLNDGTLLHATRSEWGRYGEWLAMRVREQYSRSVRLKDMPTEWFMIPDDAPLSNPLVAYVHYVRCIRTLDALDFDGARAQAQAFLDRAPEMPLLYKYGLLTSLAFIELLSECRPDILVSLVDEQVQNHLLDDAYLSSIRTRYAFALLADDNKKKAAEFRRQFDALAERYPFPVVVEGERELMDLVDVRHKEVTKGLIVAVQAEKEKKAIEEPSATWYYEKESPWR